MKKLDILLISIVFILGFIILDTYTGLTVAETNQFLTQTENILRNVLRSEFIDTFSLRQEINNALQRLNAYKSELINLNNTERALTIKNEINSLVRDLPKSIEVVEVVRDVIKVEPRDLEAKFEDFNQLYDLQKGIIVSVEAKLVRITYFSDAIMEKTIINKDIVSIAKINDAYVYELIPSKTISLEKLIFLVEPKKVGNIFRWYASEISDKPITISYVIDGNALNKIYNLKTLVVPKIQQVLIKREASCGDNICTKPFEDEIVCPEDCSKRKSFNIAFIILASIILVLGIFYLNFYRGKFDFRTWFKTPFRNKQDLDNVKNFINNALKKDINKEKTTRTLIEKSWSKKQIAFAYEQVEWENRKVLLETAPFLSKDLKPLYNYIKECLKYNIDKDKIRAKLLIRGWSDKSINEVFDKIK